MNLSFLLIYSLFLFCFDLLANNRLSSDGAENILMNCVSICFIMSIDDTARQAFQRQCISDHIDSIDFIFHPVTTVDKMTGKGDTAEEVFGTFIKPTAEVYDTFAANLWPAVCFALAFAITYVSKMYLVGCEHW